MNISVQGSGSFRIVDGHIVEINGNPFAAVMEGDTLSLLSSGNNISIKGGNTMIQNSSNGEMYIDGINISTQGKTLIIDGDIEKIILNGTELAGDDTSSEIETKKELKENEFLKYQLNHPISSISIKGSGSFTIHAVECDCRLDESLIFSIMGSGDIAYSNTLSTKSIIASVKGSGDIVLSEVHGDSIVASVMGSGDIIAKSSSFKNVNKTVIGSGDIVGL